MAEKVTISYERLTLHDITDADVSDISALGKLLVRDLKRFREPTRADIIAAATRHVMLVARVVSDDPGRRKKIVGMGRLIISESPATGRDAIIADVVVLGGRWRGKNIGLGISKLLLSIAKEHKVLNVWLRTSEERAPAHKLYESLGFRRKNSRVYAQDIAD